MSFVNLSDIEEKEIIPGFRVRFVHSEHMTLAYWNIQAGARLPEHAHPHEQVASVIEGDFELTLEGEAPRLLKAGGVAVIPSQARHSGLALTNCRIIDTFYPVREDYRS